MGANAPAISKSNASAPASTSAGKEKASVTPAVDIKQQDQRLIESSRQAYTNGVTLYQTARYEQARADFNRAVDVLLSSGRDLKSDPVLYDAFNRTVDKINALELDSLQQSNGFSQQEQSPVGVANDVTFPVDPNLLARAQADLKRTQSDLPLMVNDYVASYINYFTNTKKGHNTIENSLTRGGRYRAIVEQTLAKEGVPKDLIYLAIAESGFRPRAINARSGAGGMWQFMPHGNYGLLRNGWVDERFDPEKSTQAYARYIKELHEQFGDWYLAMAAYDWGPGKVQRAVQRTGYADFWELYQRNVLPPETKNYVPIILAAAIMAKNPAQYGLADIPVDPPLSSDTVTTTSSINLNLVADLVGTTADEIQQLNPSLLRMATPAGMAYDLHLPSGTAQLFQQRIAAIPDEHRNSWRYHVATPEDTLASIAQSFHVKLADLAAVNELHVDDPVHAGEALVVPVAPVAATRHLRYRVRRGDSIVTVADRFGVTTTQLRRWNRIAGNRLQVGKLLYVSEPVLYGRRSFRRSTHGHPVTSARRSSRGATRSRSRAPVAPQRQSGKKHHAAAHHTDVQISSQRKNTTQE